MKTTNILYWVFTIIFAALMIFSSVDNVAVGKDSVALISTMLPFPESMIPFLGVAKILGVTVTAEGIERPGQLEWLRARGCNEVQGFLLAEPRTPAEP